MKKKNQQQQWKLYNRWKNSRITIIDTSSVKMELNLAHRMSIISLLGDFILLYFMSSFFFVSQKYLSFCFFSHSSLRIEDVQNAHTNVNEIKKITTPPSVYEITHNLYSMMMYTSIMR